MQLNVARRFFVAGVLASLVSTSAQAGLPAGFADITLAVGFTNASCLAIAPDGRILVGQQNGLIRVVKNGSLLPAPFVALGLPYPTTAQDERALVGIAFDPGFATNNFVYLHYTVGPSTTVTQRISRVTANGDVATPGSETVLIETDPFTANREVGGGLAFGPDGMLYVGIGMCGNTANSQITNNLFGKILRIGADGTIPGDNPFAQNTGRNRAVWAVGLRNPFAISFHRSSGRLFINDVGSTSTTAREEINEGIAGANYGWALCEGNCANPTFRSPIYFYTHTNSFNAITAGAFYNFAASPFPTQYFGKYFFGDLATSTIQLLDPAITNATAFATGLSGNMVSLQVGPDGALYYLVQANSPSAGIGLVGKIVYGAQTLLPFGSSWKYLDDGSSPPANWVQPLFDDSSWSNGVTQLGFGGNGELTTIRATRTDTSRITTHYFRKSFVVTNTAPFTNYVLSVVRDDGAIVYVNGVEVFRSNMPTGAVNSTTLAPLSVGGFDERAPFGVMIDPALLVSGTNVIAVEVHQNSIAAATDLSFNLGLFSFDGKAGLRAILSGGALTLAYPSWAERFILESSTNVPSASWLPVDTNSSTVVNGERLVPVTTDSPQQFFRLRSP